MSRVALFLHDTAATREGEEDLSAQQETAMEWNG